MTIAPAASSACQEDLLIRLSRQPIWVYCVVAALYFAFCDYNADPERLVRVLGDTDDATRLATVREYMANGAWFDRGFNRLGGSDPLISHWSMLIDLPLAILISAFGLMVSSATAELLARALWPVILLFVLLWSFGGHLERRHGKIPAIIGVGLIVYASTVVAQFNLGRIDHHNAQILAAGAGFLLLAESFAVPRMGWIAGLVLGLGTAVGYEALSLTAAGLAIAALIAAWNEDGLEGVSNAATAFAATLFIAFVLTNSPSQWFNIYCDELALNLVLLAVAGASGLFAVWKCAGMLPRLARLAILGCSGLAGLAAYGLAEPVCLQGPFSQAGQAIFPIWLDHVQDTNNFRETIALMPEWAILTILTTALGAWATYTELRRKRDNATLLLSVIFAIATVLMFWQVKFAPYATLLALPALAVAISRLEATERMTSLTRRLLAFMFANQHTALAIIAICTGALGLAGEGQSTTASSATQKSDTCFEAATVQALNSLKKGLFVGHYDLGPFIVAHTQHDALAGPYHRLHKAIVEVHEIGSAAPAAAERRLRAAGADYVIDCTLLPALPGTAKDGFIPQLKAGVTPSFLEAVALPAQNPLRVWRVRPAETNPD